MLHDHRRRLARRDQDVGERLVVAQQHVEARAQPLDQVGFEEERFGLGRGRNELDGRGRRNHAHDARGMAGLARIRRYPFADALGLADVEDLALGVEHAIDAGAGRGVLRISLDRRHAARQRAGRCVLVDRGQARFLLVLLEVELRLNVGFGVVGHQPENRDSRGSGPVSKLQTSW
jgi:hypothetical protein